MQVFAEGTTATQRNLSDFSVKEKIQQFKENWSRKSPRQKWHFSYRIGEVEANFIGIRVLSDFGTNLLTYFGICIGLFYAVSSIYTLQYYARQGEFFVGLQCLCCIGWIISSFIMYWKAIGPQKYKFHNLANFAGNYIYPKDNGVTSLHKLCNKSAKDLLKQVISIQVIILISYLSVVVGPIHAYLFNDIYVTPMGTRLPFFGQNVETEFFVNVGLQCLFAAYALLGNLAIETCSCLIDNTILLSAEVIQLNADELSKRLEVEQNFHEMDIKTRASFRNFLLKIIDFDGYVAELIAVYYDKFFAATVGFTFAISLSIFSQLVMGFPGGYGFAVCSYLQLIIMCYMGRNVQIANDNICRALTGMAWHLMPPLARKDVGHILNRIQNGAVLTIGPFSTLNFETASNITKLIYKVLMLLLRFSE